jgi:3-oxoacyl-[acyl-carrier protein] reductase
MKLRGKVAIITGGGRGLGRAIALAMAKEGARSIVVSRSWEEIQEVLSQIRGAGGEAFAFLGDVSREDHVSRMVEEGINRFSTVDILVNNAAIIGPARFLNDGDFKSWQKTIDINLHGTFLCSHAVLPIMTAQKSGKIINISSGLGQMPYPRFCAYAVSKAGIIQLTRSLAEEFEEYNIQVNSIDPGIMDTSMQREIRDLGSQILGEKIHFQFREFKEEGLLKDAAQVAPLAVFLASSDSAQLSGHNGTLDYYRNLGWQP